MGLEQVELFIAVEDHFGITIGDHAAGQIKTLGDLHAAVLARLEPPPNAQQAWDELLVVLLHEFPDRAPKLTPQARLYDDLGLN